VSGSPEYRQLETSYRGFGAAVLGCVWVGVYVASVLPECCQLEGRGWPSKDRGGGEGPGIGRAIAGKHLTENAAPAARERTCHLHAAPR